MTDKSQGFLRTEEYNFSWW